MILRCGGDGWTASRRRLRAYSLLTTKRPKNKAMIGSDGALRPGCFSQSASRRLEHLPDFPVNLVICTYARGSSVVLVPPPLMRFLFPWVRVKRLWLRIPCSRLPPGQSASGAGFVLTRSIQTSSRAEKAEGGEAPGEVVRWTKVVYDLRVFSTAPPRLRNTDGGHPLGWALVRACFASLCIISDL